MRTLIQQTQLHQKLEVELRDTITYWIILHPRLNQAILVEYKTLWHVVFSVAEANVAGVLNHAQIRFQFELS